MEYYNVDVYSRAVTTGSDEAQLWFNRGLNWSYGFHHEEVLFAVVRPLPVTGTSNSNNNNAKMGNGIA